ncbi:MAG: hypothetical protein KBC56_04805 [Flavobacterium sp.]|nr:hypothetical protein [Flavobacterium sp.]
MDASSKKMLNHPIKTFFHIDYSLMNFLFLIPYQRRIPSSVLSNLGRKRNSDTNNVTSIPIMTYFMTFRFGF